MNRFICLVTVNLILILLIGCGRCEKLFKAVKNGKKENVRKLLEKGVDVDVRDRLGRTPLMHAVKHKNDQVVGLLLRFGAEVSLKDDSGKTALHR